MALEVDLIPTRRTVDSRASQSTRPGPCVYVDIAVTLRWLWRWIWFLLGELLILEVDGKLDCCKPLKACGPAPAFVLVLTL